MPKIVPEIFQLKNIPYLDQKSCMKGIVALIGKINAKTSPESDVMKTLETVFRNVYGERPGLLERALNTKPGMNFWFFSPFSNALGKRNIDLTKLCLAFGADPNSKLNDSRTVMQVTAAAYCEETLAACLQHGGDINAGLEYMVNAGGLHFQSLSSQSDATPLYYLVQKESERGLALALEAGVYLDSHQLKAIRASRVLNPILEQHAENYHFFPTHPGPANWPVDELGLPKKNHQPLCKPFQEIVTSSDASTSNIPDALRKEYAALHQHTLVS